MPFTRKDGAEETRRNDVELAASEESPSDSEHQKQTRAPISASNGDAGLRIHAGSMVWMKLKYFPWWPAQICNARNAAERQREARGKERLVHSFGDHRYAWVRHDKVVPFDTHLEEYRHQKGPSLFKEAIEEALEFQKTNQHKIEAEKDSPDTKAIQIAKNDLLDFEDTLSWDAVKEDWLSKRDDWIEKVEYASTQTELKAGVLMLERAMKRTALPNFDAEGWRSSVKLTARVGDLMSRFRALRSAVADALKNGTLPTDDDLNSASSPTNSTKEMSCSPDTVDVHSMALVPVEAIKDREKVAKRRVGDPEKPAASGPKVSRTARGSNTCPHCQRVIALIGRNYESHIRLCRSRKSLEQKKSQLAQMLVRKAKMQRLSKNRSSSTSNQARTGDEVSTTSLQEHHIRSIALRPHLGRTPRASSATVTSKDPNRSRNSEDPNRSRKSGRLLSRASNRNLPHATRNMSTPAPLSLSDDEDSSSKSSRSNFDGPNSDGRHSPPVANLSDDSDDSDSDDDGSSGPVNINQVGVFAWGMNRDGQVGVESGSSLRSPQLLNELAGKAIVSLDCGVAHTAAVTDSGLVYTWGCNTHGQTIHRGTSCVGTPKVPSAVPRTHKKFVQVACGGWHTICLTDEGEVYTCGDNDHGQLGRDAEPVNFRPVAGLKDKVVKHIAAGSLHTAVILEGGQLFTWGWNGHGQLGHSHGGEAKITTPQRVDGFLDDEVVFIACGGRHTAAITARQRLFTWGSNEKGQLGHSDTEDCHVPKLVISLQEQHVKTIACGGWHTFALTENGKLYSWGWNRYGQLGTGDRKDQIEPILVAALSDHFIQQIECGEWHSAAVSGKQELFFWGWGGACQLGVGEDTKDRLLPTRLPCRKSSDLFCSISCGSGHSAILAATTGDAHPQKKIKRRSDAVEEAPRSSSKSAAATVDHPEKDDEDVHDLGLPKPSVPKSSRDPTDPTSDGHDCNEHLDPTVTPTNPRNNESKLTLSNVLKTISKDGVTVAALKKDPGLKSWKYGALFAEALAQEIRSTCRGNLNDSKMPSRSSIPGWHSHQIAIAVEFLKHHRLVTRTSSGHVLLSGLRLRTLLAEVKKIKVGAERASVSSLNTASSIAGPSQTASSSGTLTCLVRCNHHRDLRRCSYLQLLGAPSKKPSHKRKVAPSEAPPGEKKAKIMLETQVTGDLSQPSSSETPSSLSLLHDLLADVDRMSLSEEAKLHIGEKLREIVQSRDRELEEVVLESVRVQKEVLVELAALKAEFRKFKSER